MYQLVTSASANSWHQAGRPWKIRLEFRGYNADNKKGSSSKFWEMYSKGQGHPVYINWGKIGTQGLSNPSPKDFWEAIEVQHAKLDKGYVYANGSCPHHALPSEPKLPGPLGLVARIHGTPATGYKAVDLDGNLVMKLTKVGAADLYQASREIRDNSPGVVFG